MLSRSLFSKQSLLLCSAFFVFSLNALPDAFSQTNLVSSVPGMAAVTDSNLKNPWGMSFSATSPFWISNQATNTSTLYGANGTPNALVVSVPGGPTGQVFTGGTSFVEPNGSTPNFVFATISGSIYAWNNGNGTTAQLTATTAGATYTGLAISGNFLYAANVRGGTIDVFNSSFAPTTLAGSFRDPNLPAGYTPYNIQNVNGLLYVEYQNGAQAGTGGLGTGIVSVFDANGVFQRRLISTGGQLDQPWGIVVAPASWGAFANDLLVGNFGNGEINAFNPTTGAFVGTVTDSNGQPIVNSGLWALATRTGPGFNPNAVYFAAGINGETQGLFGTITPTPEPMSLGMAAIGGLAIVLVGRRRLRMP
ncbi:MAG: TIGR03118 family protein [Bryobacteraceae bacterium]